MPDFLRTPKKKDVLAQAKRDTKARKSREKEQRKKRLALERIKAWTNGDMHAFLRLHMMRPGDVGRIDPTKPLKRYVAAERQSNVTGVTWETINQCWVVTVWLDGKPRRLGRFKHQQHAEYACLQAKQALGIPNRPKGVYAPKHVPKGVRVAVKPAQLELSFDE